jgi:hypothetical protein
MFHLINGSPHGELPWTWPHQQPVSSSDSPEECPLGLPTRREAESQAARIKVLLSPLRHPQCRDLLTTAIGERSQTLKREATVTDASVIANALPLLKCSTFNGSKFLVRTYKNTATTSHHHRLAISLSLELILY